MLFLTLKSSDLNTSLFYKSSLYLSKISFSTGSGKTNFKKFNRAVISMLLKTKNLNQQSQR